MAHKKCGFLYVPLVPEDGKFVFKCNHPDMEPYRPGRDYDLVELFCRPGVCRTFEENREMRR